MVDDMSGWLWLASERGLLGVSYDDGHHLIQLGEGEGLLGAQISELRMDGTDRLWVAWKIRKLHSYQNTNSNSKTKKT